MSRQMFSLGLLALLIAVCSAAQMTYTIGGSDVIFVFSRTDNVSTVTWTDFAAAADGNGAINTGSTSTVPSAYAVGSAYVYPPEGLVRCAGVASGLAYVRVNQGSPAIQILPVNGNDTAWSSGQSVLLRAGFVTYSNV